MTSLALIAYQITGTLLLPLITSALFIRSLTQREYRQHMAERLGVCPNKIKQGGIVIHGSSLGEINALKPFIEQTIKAFPERSITVTCFTPTGRNQIANLFSNRVNYSYLPIDSPVCTAVFLARIKPAAIVFMETEIWPNLIAQANRRGIKQILINARLSERSIKRYKQIYKLIAPALKALDGIYPQSQQDLERFLSLTVNQKQCEILGNIKYDITLNPSFPAIIEDLKNHTKNRLIWVIGSSHEDEEDMLLNTAKQLINRFSALLIVIAPRHKERFKPIEQKLNQLDLTWISRKQQIYPSPSTQVWLIDTIGELLLFYGIADICTVAGSFGDTGGHNPLEPGLFQKCTTIGPNMRNAQEMAFNLLAADAVIQNKDAVELYSTLNNLLTNESRRKELGKNAGEFITQNKGSTTRSLNKLKELIGN